MTGLLRTIAPSRLTVVTHTHASVSLTLILTLSPSPSPSRSRSRLRFTALTRPVSVTLRLAAKPSDAHAHRRCPSMSRMVILRRCGSQGAPLGLMWFTRKGGEEQDLVASREPPLRHRVSAASGVARVA